MGLEIVTSDARADPANLARELLDEMQSFFADPANEAEFQEWQRARDRETA